MEHPTKPLKDYEIFYERPRNQPIWSSTILRRDSINLTSTYPYSQDPPWPSPRRCRHVRYHSRMCPGLEQFLHCLKHHNRKHQWSSWILWKTQTARSQEKAKNPLSR
jgi:hypothetical protein